MVDYKLVNGELIALTPEEQAEHDARSAIPPARYVPAVVSASGIIRALEARGLLPAVDAVVGQADDLMKRLWERAPTFDRNDPMVLTVARFLGMEDQLDDLFREAAVL